MVHRETSLKIPLHRLDRHVLFWQRLTNKSERYIWWPVYASTVRLVARTDEVSEDTIPTPRFARKSSAWNPPQIEEACPQNYMVDQERLQISGLHFDKFPALATFSCWKIRCNNRSMRLFQFTHGSNVMDQRSRNGRFSGQSWVIALNSRISFPEFWGAGCEDCVISARDHPELQLQEKVSLEEQKAHLQDRVLRGRQIAFMIHECFRATGVRDDVLDYAELFYITFRNDDVQEIDTRWEEILFSLSKFPSDDVLENLYKLRGAAWT